MSDLTPLDFGAVPGTDCSTAIDAAAAAADTFGVPLVIPPETFFYSNPTGFRHTVGGSIKIVGKHQTRSIIKADSSVTYTGPLIGLWQDGDEVSNLTIDQDGAPITSGWGALTFGGDDFKALDVNIERFTQFGITGDSVKYGTIEGGRQRMHTPTGAHVNHAINIASTVTMSEGINISRTRSFGSGVIVQALRCNLDKMLVDGTHYGAGVVTAGGDTYGEGGGHHVTDATCINGVGQDSDGTWVMGFEASCWSSTYTGCHGLFNSGAGFGIIGKSQTFLGCDGSGNGVSGHDGIGFKIVRGSVHQATDLMIRSCRGRDFGAETQMFGAYMHSTDELRFHGISFADNDFRHNVMSDVYGEIYVYGTTKAESIMSFRGRRMAFSAAWPAVSIAPGGSYALAVTAPGAFPDDSVAGIDFGTSLSGMTETGYIESINLMVIVVANNTATTKTMPANTVWAHVEQAP